MHPLDMPMVEFDVVRARAQHKEWGDKIRSLYNLPEENFPRNLHEAIRAEEVLETELVQDFIWLHGILTDLEKDEREEK